MHVLPLLLALTFAGTPGPGGYAGLCVPQYQVLHPELCPDMGPGAYAAELASSQLPAALPPIPAERLPKLDPVVAFTYARVTTPNAPLFTSPADSLPSVITHTLGKGLIFVNVIKTVQQGDQTFAQIRQGDYLRASDLKAVTPTDFRGATFSAPPAYPVGWVVLNTRPSLQPGAAPPPGPALTRRTLVQIYATQHVGAWDWYLIGPQQWVDQRTVARVDVNPPPEGVSGKWIQVNLFEQTLAAYEDNRLVFATLVSSGLDKWPTRPGLFHIYLRLETDRMAGSYEPDKSDYYYLETVPWVMYFDGQRALHGEYWHDQLGFKRSHGCVNMAPLDARWLFNWAPNGTPVWVYDPSGQTPADTAGGGAP